jgi:alanyl-tRNA synthetase
MKSVDVRKKFFEFFEKQGHTVVESSPVIPAQDPTLLFANAGMNQFKDVFLGLESRAYTRAVTIQKCIRAGGKHNDLDNVGFTKRHLTFFEMMGNFSFGDYFKKEAILFAWEFLTKHMSLPIEKLYATVYKTDDQAYDLWHSVIGIPKERIYRLGEQENFWQMGDMGPCGPCTEIHIDRGPEFGCADIAACGPACDCDRFLELWNLVFMQYDRQPDGSDKPLKKTGVDTGMGLERLCVVLQNKDSVFEIDLFAPLIQAIEHSSGLVYKEQSKQIKGAFHVLVDHIRSASFIIADGAAPSNEGRGYVLRKIIRRAALFAQKLGNPLLFADLSKQLVAQMGSIYPELVTNQDIIFSIISSEIKKFADNLVRGQNMLARYFQEQTDTKSITGAYAFKLYDTYGFPLELLHVMAKEHGFTIDKQGFEQLMQQQQEQSGKKVADELSHIELEGISTEFTGYQELKTTSEITGLIHRNAMVKTVAKGELCWVIAEKSPFFIVGGGQVPDQGWLVLHGQRVPLQAVRFIQNAIGVQIEAPATITVGDAVTSIVNEPLRINAMKNHTATHLLQAALIELFGKQIKQSGSLVHPDYLRFDFTYHQNLNAEDIAKVEDLVNQKIRENIPVTIQYTSLKEAIAQGALAFFGDKYNPEQVRMVMVPHFSVELCGGTHVRATGDIGVFKITEVTALSAGHRRIVALTGPRALALFQETYAVVKQLSTTFKVKKEEVLEAIEKQQEQLKHTAQQVKELKKQLMQAQVPQLIQQTSMIGDMPFLFLSLSGMGADELKELAQQLDHAQAGFYFLLSTLADKHIFYAHLSSAYGAQLDLKKFAQWLSATHNLRGGGSKTHLQGGGTVSEPASLQEAIAHWLKDRQK